MSVTVHPQRGAAGRLAVDPAGLAWFLVAILAALPLFWIGFTGLAAAWSRPEYSHGPVIPLLSFYMFLREMREVPPATGPVTDRRLGVAVVGLALSIAALGNLVQIDDIVFYAMIVWIGGLVLTLFGTRRGFVFWPSVLHLVFMLPLPQFLYWRLNTGLQFVSSEIGVCLRRAHGGAGLPRRQHHRPRGLQAAGGRGLLGPALPVPDHELHLRLRGALPRPALAQGGAAPLGGAARGPDELVPDRGDRRPRRPLRHRPGRGLPALLRGLGGLPRLHRAPVPDGQGDAAAVGRPPAARRGARPRLLRHRGRARPRPRHPGLARAGRGRAPHRRALRRLGAPAARARPSRRRAIPSPSSRPSSTAGRGRGRRSTRRSRRRSAPTTTSSALWHAPRRGRAGRPLRLLLPQPDRGRGDPLARGLPAGHRLGGVRASARSRSRCPAPASGRSRSTGRSSRRGSRSSSSTTGSRAAAGGSPTTSPPSSTPSPTA